MSLDRRELLRRGLACGALFPLSSCLPMPGFPFDLGDAPRDGLKVQFFSVACFLIEQGDTAVLTDPFFTHLPFGRVVKGPVVAAPSQVDPYRHLLKRVKAIPIGHAHYDHVLDLEAIAPDVDPAAQVLGSRTLKHQYAATGLPLAIHAVNEDMATEDRAGRWIEIVPGRLRILPIRSGHPDQVAGIHLFTKRFTEDRDHPPTKVHHYQEGQTLAFLIDFLEGETIEWRVYAQTSSRGLPDGLFPAGILAERPVDLALLAMDCAKTYLNRKRSIIGVLQPREVLFCHYGNFFRGKDDPPQSGTKLNMKRLHRLLPDTETTRFRFPGWDEVFHFGRERRG